MNVGGKPGKGRPGCEKGVAKDENSFVPENVSHAAADEEKGAEGQGVRCGEPGGTVGVGDLQVLSNVLHGSDGLTETCKRHELREDDDEDEGNLVVDGDVRRETR